MASTTDVKPGLRRSTRAMHVALFLVGMGLSSISHAQEEKSELVVWNWVTSAPVTAQQAGALANQQEFLNRFPHISVRSGGGPQLQKFGRGTREFLMAQAGGVAPDIVEVSDVDLQDFVSRRFLLSLNDPIGNPEKLDSVFRHPLAENFIFNDQVYALPGTPVYPRPQTLVLIYRRDLFRRAGLDPDKPPTNWRELIDCATQLTDPSKGIVGLVLPTMDSRGVGAGSFVELIMALNGVKVVQRDAAGQWLSNIGSDERAVEAMLFLRELIGREVRRENQSFRGISASSAGSVDDPTMLAATRAAMIIEPMEGLPWHGNRGISTSDLGVALLPLGPSGSANGDGFVPLTARYLGVNALSPPERQKTAWEWIGFNQRPEVSKLRAKAYIDAGWMKFLDPREVEADPQYAGFVSEIPEQWQTVWRTMMDRAKPLPMCPEHRRLRQDFLARPVWALLADPNTDVRDLLKKTEKAINEELLGHVPQQVHERRRRIGLGAVVLVGASLLVGGWLVVRSIGKGSEGTRTAGTVGVQAGRGRMYLIAGAMMLPAVLSTILWAYLPLGRGAMMAFQDYQIAGDSRWTGVDNFVAVLTDKLFWISIWRTIQYAIITLTLGFVAPIVLAFLLAEVPRFRVPLRVIYCLPAMTSGLVILFFFKWMYEPSKRGLFNSIIHTVGSWFGQDWGPLKWLESESLAMVSVILPGVWASLGVGSIIYLAALHSVPEEMYEAADLDGAGAWTKVWNIALPHIKPLVIINFVGAFIATFQAMQNVFVTTGGGPGDATYLVGLYIFLNSFVWLQFGKATAAAWIIGSLLIGFTVFQLRLLRNLKFQAATDNEKER